MHSSIQAIHSDFTADIAAVKTTAEIENLKIKYLGKKGFIQNLMKFLKEVNPEQRPAFGKEINELKEDVLHQIEEHEKQLIAKEEDQQLAQEKIDITLPGRRPPLGRKHIITQALDSILDILVGMGFSVQYGPDIDTDYYNFEALNFSSDHPARDMQDTFYITPDVLLRTHTSNVQVRVMEAHQPPIRIITPGKAYRNETITARSHVFFHQVEGLYIDKGVTFADLLATMQEFFKQLFRREIETRYRPSYFPFVEPGLEVDISCLSCKGKGCQLCKHSGWLEVAGAGMVHPEVLKNGGIDPEVYSGYAWGIGVERMVLLKHGVKDIRLFTENDLRFLEQFTHF
ncbi:phenylalanine--tRNA ligase subunit alpha [Neochlamydia sp. TUME1]|uniref:phenylalanine--tRNA ligase subunit alpha n=1 Tax=Neochlamydia sp. TUME1 TaxID=1478174 RepID=UPI00057D4C0B|nr:phenylalanine--tRNA ligase subunit alpha [Neochlamydia sp. TUME1]